MKVLLVAPFPPPYGGIANWSVMLSEHMKQTADELVVLNIAPKKRSTEGRTIFDRIVVSGIDMHKKKSELTKMIRTNKPDIIHMTTSGSLAIIRDVLLLKTAKKHHVPAVYHIRFGKTEQMASSKAKLWGLFSKAMKLAHTVIAIDKTTYDAIRKYVPEANAVLVPNPVNMSKLPPRCAQTKKQVTFLGWVVPEKGMGELIEAWNTVGAVYPDYTLQIIGQSKPEYFDKLKATVSVPNVCFTGEMAHDDAMTAVAESEIFILPSYTEGFPNAVVEAMALKNAVIGTAVGAIPEMLADDCGIVISPKNSEEIISALKTVLDDPHLSARMAQNAYDKAYTQYEIGKVYKRYQEIWSKTKED